MSMHPTIGHSNGRLKTAVSALVAAVGLAAGVTALSAHTTATSAQPPATNPDAFTPLIQEVIAPPWPVKGSDGKYHVVYELQMVNATGLPWEVRKVSVLNADDPREVVASVSGKGISEYMVRMGDRQPTKRVGPGQAALFFAAGVFDTREQIPAGFVHRLVLRNVSKPRQGPRRVTEIGGRTGIVAGEPAVLGPPLQGARWVAADGCCTAFRHVRSGQPYGNELQIAQRFAIDWLRLDKRGRLFVGDKRRLRNWAGYGANILAVADGTVVRTFENRPDQVPGALPEGIGPDEADGNGVILRLPDGRYVSYAHMIPGSVAVKAGDTVSRGQLLGRLGNSGNSSAPHMHLHGMDRAAILGANGLPYVFDRFTITGKVASTAAFDRAEATGKRARMGPVRRGPRQNELTLDQVIVTWP
jgi:hypothetical protein